MKKPTREVRNGVLYARSAYRAAPPACGYLLIISA